MTETTTEDNVWYLARDGKQHGPLTHLEMTKLVELGHLRTADLVWRPGFDNWRPAPSIFELTAPSAPKPAAPTAARPAPAGAPAPEPAANPATAFATAPSAARPQPSFASLSAPAQPAKPEPARFEFPRPELTERLETSRSGSAFGTPAAREPDPQPMSFDTRAFRPAGPSSQFGSPTSSDPSTSEPFLSEPMPDMATPKKGRGFGVALGLLIAAGGVAAAGYTYRDTIKASLQSIATAPQKIPVVEAPAATNGTAPPAPQTAAEPAPPASALQTVPGNTAASAPDAPSTLAGVPVTATPVDADWQSSPFWSLAKTEFAQWYSDRVREVGELKAAHQPDAAIDQKLVEAIVVLRRQNASKALAASPERLKLIAEAFVANLNAMQSQSSDACYDFIGKGELTPAAAALVQKPAQGPALHAQLGAVFNAVVDGQKNPVTRASPQPTDYNLLAAELGTIGWSQADIQLFADPKALAAAPRDRVCTMVKDWFTAHLSVKDDAARERLLYETLRLVIAG